MQTTIALVALHLRLLARDRLALAATFLLPVLVAALMVSIYESEDPGIRPIQLGVLSGADVDTGTDGGSGPTGDGSAVEESIVGHLDESPIVEVSRYRDRESLERAVRLAEVEAGVVIPVEVGETGAAHFEDPSAVQLLGPPSAAAPGGVRAAVESAVAETAAALYVGDALDTTATAERKFDLGVRELAAVPRATDHSPEASRFRLQGAAASAVQATMVLFVFTNTMVAGGLMITELREGGILARARTSRATAGSLAVAGTIWLAAFALLQALLVHATGTLLFDVHWLSPGPTLAGLVLLAAAAGGLGLVFGSVLPSSELSVIIGGPLGFFLAMVGGALWPLDFVGPPLETIGRSMPHAWAIDALNHASIYGDGLVDIALPLAVLAGAAVMLVAVGSVRLYRLSEQA